MAPLDEVLGGGYPRGSCVLLESLDAPTDRVVWGIAVRTVVNFLLNGRGAMLVPPDSMPLEEARRSVVLHVPAGLFDAQVRIVDFVGRGPPAPWVVSDPQLATAGSRGMRRMVAAESAVRGRPPSPFVEVTDLAALDRVLQPHGTSRFVWHASHRVREVGNLAIYLGRTGTASTARVAELAETHLSLAPAPDGWGVTGRRPEFLTRFLGTVG